MNKPINYSFVFISLSALIFFVGILGLPGLAALPGYAAEKSNNKDVFSLKIEDEPLAPVLEKISRITGYHIIMSKGFEQVRLSLHLDGVTIEQGLSRLAKAMGKPGHVVITDESKKEAKVIIFDSDQLQVFKSPHLQGEKQSLTQWRPLSQDELEAIKKAAEIKVRNKDAVVGPPSFSGERRLTRGELKALQQEAEQKRLSDKTETGPQPLSGGSRLTRGQIKDIQKAANSRVFTKQTPVGPQPLSGAKRLTHGEVEAMQDKMAAKKHLSMDEKVGPPSLSGGKRLTRGELEALHRQAQ